MLHDIIFLVVVLIAIVRGIVRFSQWVKRSLAGASAPGAARPGQMPTPARPAAPMPMPPRQPLTSDLPAPPPARPRTRETESGNQRPPTPMTDPSPTRLAGPLAGAPSVAPTRAWLASPDDLVRAFILQEVLAPPTSQRRRKGR